MISALSECAESALAGPVSGYSPLVSFGRPLPAFGDAVATRRAAARRLVRVFS